MAVARPYAVLVRCMWMAISFALARIRAEVNVILMEGDEKPSGVGEPPMGPIAPAIANAVFDATGQRLRQLPLQKELSSIS